MVSLPLLLLLASALADLARALPRACPPCGKTTIPFPLSTSPSCNDQNYPVACNHTTGTLLFAAINNTLPLPPFPYPILSINPSTQRLVIRPAPFLSPSTCITSDFPNTGLYLNDSLPFNITSTNTLLYLNCTDLILRSPLNCSASSPCRRYVTESAEGRTACGHAGICCALRAGGGATAHHLRTSGAACSAYRSFLEIPPEGGGGGGWAEKEGVEIQWALPREPECRGQGDCADGANATCREDGAAPGGARGARRCFCVEGLLWDPIAGSCVYNETNCHDTGDCRGSNRGPLTAGLVSGLAAILLFSAALGIFLGRRRQARRARERLARERESILNSENAPGSRHAHYFTGSAIRRATCNFSRDNLLGSGGYGEVFRGSLLDGTPVAVKVAKLGNAKSTDQVLNEVRVLSQVNHRCLVRLLGCCVELEQPLMVYEYVPNGTLSDQLHGPRQTHPPLAWGQRLAIAHQTAMGLAYLHFAAVQPIYHRDVKSSNILLDEGLNAKVSDFGLSRLAEVDVSHVSTCAQGTLGYLDPEYYRNYQLTDKSDVYSFGVVLLELLTSQKAIDFNRGTEDVNLAVFVQRMVDEERLMEVVDPWLKEGASQVALDTMKAVGFLAVGCLEEKRQNRPSMKEVVEEIECIIKIEAGGVEHDSFSGR